MLGVVRKCIQFQWLHCIIHQMETLKTTYICYGCELGVQASVVALMVVQVVVDVDKMDTSIQELGCCLIWMTDGGFHFQAHLRRWEHLSLMIAGLSSSLVITYENTS